MSPVSMASTSRLRSLGDALWVAGFAASLIWLLGGARGASQPESGLLLELRPGLQQQVLLRRGERLGTLQHLTRREKDGWTVQRTVQLGGVRAALVEQRLRSDLSLARLRLEVSLDRLGPLLGPLVGRTALLRELGNLGTLRLEGPCRLETGACLLSGRLGTRPLSFPVQPGRGPVLAATIYPLLARGRLGRIVELSLFDPLALQPHRVSLRVEGRDSLELPAGRRTGVRVRTEAAGLVGYLWLDPGGMPLREEMPLGIRADHEWWRSSDE